MDDYLRLNVSLVRFMTCRSFNYLLDLFIFFPFCVSLCMMYICICVCEFVHVVAQVHAQMCICVHVCGDPSCCQVSLSIVFHFINWVGNAYWTWSLSFWLICLTSLLQGFSVGLPSPGITGGLPHSPSFYLESGDLNSGLPACITSKLLPIHFSLPWYHCTFW